MFERVLVTGAGGLLGRHVMRELAGRAAVTGLDLGGPPDGDGFIRCDVTDAEGVAAAVRGHDAVVHVAAMANIWAGPPERIMAVNVLGTWNVLAAAEAAGVRRVVLCSSDSVIGFTVLSGAMLPPTYLPIDEAHPPRPTDAYALSKHLGEQIGQSFAARGGLEVVVLRPVFVLYPEMEGEILARAADPNGYRYPAAGGPTPPGGGPLWHHVDPRDAARAFGLALELPRVRFETFFLCAADTLAPEPTLERLERYLGGRLPELRESGHYAARPFAPLYDLRRASERLGFTAEHSARDRLLGAASAPGVNPGGARRRPGSQ